MNQKIKLTTHAKQRLIERTNIHSINDIQNNIFKKGYKIRHFSGAFYKFLNSKQLPGKNYSLRVYNNLIYIFNNIGVRKIITVYPVPEKYLPITQYLGNAHSPCFVCLTKKSTNLYVTELGSSVSSSAGSGFTKDIALAIQFQSEQKARNYAKNNNNIKFMQRRGWKVRYII